MVIRGEDNVIQPFGSQGPIKNGKVNNINGSRSDSSKAKESDEICTRSVSQSAHECSYLEEAASKTKWEIRQRIESGFYQSEHVIRKVAEKLLDLFGL